MDLTAAAIEKIEELSKVERFQIEGREYASKSLSLIQPPLIKVSGVATLTAVRDYLIKNPDVLDLSRVIVHVAAHDQVDIKGVVDQIQRTRENYLTAKASHQPYPFKQYLEQEDFVIAMQSYFVQAGDVAPLLAVAGGLVDENVANFGDDGTTQKVMIRQGILRNVETPVPNPVILAPYRTFMEVEQPASKFVYRIKKGRNGPEMALFEADGGNWKLQCIGLIKAWLEAELPEGVVILA